MPKLNQKFVKYLKDKKVVLQNKGKGFEIIWKESSLFPDYCMGWSVKNGNDDSVILSFTLQQKVRTKQFSDIYRMTHYVDITLSYEDMKDDDTGYPCFSIKLEEENEYAFHLYADAKAISLTDAACFTYKKYVQKYTEPEGGSGQLYYGSERRLLFLENNLASFSSLSADILNYINSTKLLNDLDAAQCDKTSVPKNIFDEVEDNAIRWKGPAHEKGRGFSDIAGMEALKQKVGDAVVWPLRHKSAADAYRIHAPGGMLLYGPPGCGKSYFAEKFAQECGFSYCLIKPSDLGSQFVHGSQKMIAELFQEAFRKAPCVICLDEVDAMIPVRRPDTSTRNDEVNEFLTQLNRCGEKGIFVIATTNMRDLIDPAALRKGRLDYQVEIPAPDALQRKCMFEYELKGRPVQVGIDTEKLALMTSGCSCSDISYIVNEAALIAARKRSLISLEMLEEQAGKMTPSLRGTSRGKIGYRSTGAS